MQGTVLFPVIANASGGTIHLKSITVEGLEQLINFMKSKIETTSVSSSDIAKYLRQGNTHPAEERPDLFSELDPDTALTYQWSRGSGRTVPLSEVVSKLKQKLNDSNRIWIDVLFINQNSLNIGLDLGNVQAIYAKCEHHVAIESGNLLNRAWCLYELLIRFKAQKQTIYVSDQKATYGVSCVGALKQTGYNYLEKMKATNSEDLKAIKHQIYLFFPGDDSDVRRAMNDTIRKQVGFGSNCCCLLS